jgi:hypothetical protein
MEDFHLQAVDHARHTEKAPHEAGPVGTAEDGHRRGANACREPVTGTATTPPHDSAPADSAPADTPWRSNHTKGLFALRYPY